MSVLNQSERQGGGFGNMYGSYKRGIHSGSGIGVPSYHHNMLGSGNGNGSMTMAQGSFTSPLSSLYEALPMIIPPPKLNISLRHFLSELKSHSPKRKLVHYRQRELPLEATREKTWRRSHYLDAGFIHRYLLHRNQPPGIVQDRKSLRLVDQRIAKEKALIEQTPKPYYPPLTDTEQDILRSVLQLPRDKKLGSAFKIDLYVHDLLTLAPGNWLNDTVVDLYLGTVLAKVTNHKCFAYTTHFYTRLANCGYQAVGRWAARKQLNVLQVDYLIVPVNRGQSHWCLALMDNIKKRFCFFDSLKNSGSTVLSDLLNYVIQEADKLQPGCHDAHVKKFESYERHPQAACPIQTNSIDCGVFMCQTAAALVNDEEPTYSMQDIKAYRSRMMYECIRAVNFSPQGV